MKANIPKKQIFDAEDLLTEESSAQTMDNGVRLIAIDRIRPF